MRVAVAGAGPRKWWFARGDVERGIGAEGVCDATLCEGVGCGENGVGILDIALVGYDMNV